MVKSSPTPKKNWTYCHNIHLWSLAWKSICLLWASTSLLQARTTHLLICIAFWRCDRILWYGRGLIQLCYVRGESRFSDHRPVYSIFTAEVQIPNQAQFGGITRSASLLGLDELPYPTYPRSYMDINFYWLCVSMEDGRSQPRFVFYTAGTGGILVGVVLFKPRCSDWCSEFHVKAFLLLIITPHVVFHCRVQTDIPRYLSGRAHLLMTDWLKFISPKVPSVGMFAANRWLTPELSHAFCHVFLCPWCLESACAMFSQMMFGNFAAIDTPIPTIFNVQILEEMLSDCKIIRYGLLKHVKDHSC